MPNRSGHNLPDPFEEYPFGRPAAPGCRATSRLWVHVALFLATVVTTTIIGAIYAGVDPLKGPCEIWRGLPFSLALLVILLSHEMGHYLASRRHGVRATLPYFIPAPIGVGTFGAFIKIKEPIRDRRSLLDIGVAGPLAGAVLSAAAIAWGLGHSQIVFTPPKEGTLVLGEPILFKALSWLVVGRLPENADVMLHPLAFAGWIGLFVTALNLIPIGQLDGGHIVFALVGPWHLIFSRFAFMALVLLGVWGGVPYPSATLYLFGIFITAFALLLTARATHARRVMYLALVFSWFAVMAKYNYDPGTGVWLFWSVLVGFLGFDHPPVYDLHRPLDGWRKVLGLCAMLLLVLTFTPKPFRIVS